MNSCEEDAVCCVSWIDSHDGNNPTKFQISEYIRFDNLVFSWFEVYPRGIHIYGVSRKPTLKYGKLYPKENDFNEAFEVDEAMRGLFKTVFTSLDSKFCGALVQFWNAKDFFRTQKAKL